MNGSSSGLRGWAATCLVVTTVSTALVYSPESRAAPACTLTLSRAEQVESGLLAIADAEARTRVISDWAVGIAAVAVGAGLLTGGALLPIAGVVAGAALAARSVVNGNPISAVMPASYHPQNQCEKAFAALPDIDRQAVIAYLQKGDTYDAQEMFLAAELMQSLPPLNPWASSGTNPSRSAATAISPGGQTASVFSSGGQNR